MYGCTAFIIIIELFISAEREHFKDLMDFAGVSDPEVFEKLASLDRGDNSLSNDMLLCHLQYMYGCTAFIIIELFIRNGKEGRSELNQTPELKIHSRNRA
jgi:hypothetical protein